MELGCALIGLGAGMILIGIVMLLIAYNKQRNRHE